jgi:hypothetical protein
VKVQKIERIQYFFRNLTTTVAATPPPALLITTMTKTLKRTLTIITTPTATITTREALVQSAVWTQLETVRLTRMTLWRKLTNQMKMIRQRTTTSLFVNPRGAAPVKSRRQQQQQKANDNQRSGKEEVFENQSNQSVVAFI